MHKTSLLDKQKSDTAKHSGIIISSGAEGLKLRFHVVRTRKRGPVLGRKQVKQYSLQGKCHQVLGHLDQAGELERMFVMEQESERIKITHH